MSNDDDMLAEYDLSAWDVPPPPADLADSVIDRMGGTDVGIAVPIESGREPRRVWIIAGVAVAVIVLALGVWSLVRSSRPAAPASGGVVAEKARTLSLDTVHADLDAGADVRWKRTGDVLYVEQRVGRVAWRVDGGEKIVIDAGATSASVEATGANLRVEVQMNATDARVIGASALTAAAVAMVTVVVYEGHVKVGRPGQQTVVVAPGTTYQIGEDTSAPVVGSAPVNVPTGKKVAILGLELLGTYGADAPVVTMVMNTTMREAAKKEGPYVLAPNTDKELVDEKLMNNCASESPQCMAAIGANLGVDVVVFGKIEQGKDGYAISLKLIDVAKKSLDRTGSYFMPAAEAEAEGLDKWGREAYLRLVGTLTAACDSDALREEGMQHVNLGQHAAALAKFEEAAACKSDQYIIQLVFMEACASGNSPKAKQYYKQLTPNQQTRFAQMCIRNKTAYIDDTADADQDCDEVSCVLNNYAGACCDKYKRPQTPALTGLTRAQILDGIAKVKSQIMACKAPAGGQLKARVDVSPSGAVTRVNVTQSPHAELTNCVRPILEKAKFAATKAGGTFSYPFVFTAAAAPSNCDATALKDQGMENINMGQHAAALAMFEASLKCKHDPYLVQLAFMGACSSRNSPKAKFYYKQLTAEQQAKYAQMCMRNDTEYQDAQSEHGWLQVFSKPSAKILVDGKDTGLVTPIKGGSLKLPVGKHKITFVIGNDRFTYPTMIKAGETATMTKDLSE